MNKRNKSLIALLLVLTVGLIGLTIAYFSNEASVENRFESKQYGTTVEEEFISPSDWRPGDSTDKTIKVTNSGEVDEAVRISYTEIWTSKNGDELSLSQNGNRAAVINFSDNNDWLEVTEGGKLYYYYKYKLAPTEETSTLIDSVTFNASITNDATCTSSSGNGNKTVICTSTGDGYDGATYKLKFKVETVQYNKYNDAWTTEVAIAEERPQPVPPTGAEYLIANNINVDSTLTYNDENADKTKMFIFNHNATDQTQALTDYRYIGNNPYNYVYFNCDDMSNQTSETCEKWRIIGVFNVERPNPENENQIISEQRIKIVRGTYLDDIMAWNTTDINEWRTASLQLELNNNYYNSLKSSSKELINNAKYYLGGLSYDSTTKYGGAEDLYIAERSENVYNGRATYWVGNIALVYPSDEYLIYKLEKECHVTNSIPSNDLARKVYLEEMKRIEEKFS